MFMFLCINAVCSVVGAASRAWAGFAERNTMPVAQQRQEPWSVYTRSTTASSTDQRVGVSHKDLADQAWRTAPKTNLFLYKKLKNVSCEYDRLNG